MMNVKPVPAIIILIVFNSVLFWAFSGFYPEEKAKAEWPNSVNLVIDEEPNDITTITLPDPNDLTLTWNEVYLEVTLEEEPNFAESDRIYLYEGDEFNIVIEKVEPNEPNESVIKIASPGNDWKCSCGQDWGEMFEILCGCGKTYKTLDIMMMCIPTWPDYIELEKDLIIKEPADICEIAGREHDFSVSIELSKGTKIYFKE